MQKDRLRQKKQKKMKKASNLAVKQVKVFFNEWTESIIEKEEIEFKSNLGYNFEENTNLFTRLNSITNASIEKYNSHLEKNEESKETNKKNIACISKDINEEMKIFKEDEKIITNNIIRQKRYY